MAVKSIQLGQVWRKDDDGRDYLVTKVYSEVFSQYAVLRPAEVTAPDAPTVRVKVAKSAQGASLPGFSFTQIHIKIASRIVSRFASGSYQDMASAISQLHRTTAASAAVFWTGHLLETTG